MTKNFYMMVGLPGSGKSTTIRRMIDEDRLKNFVIISSDDYIERYAKKVDKTYNEVFKEYVGEATKLMDADLQLALSLGVETIFWDQTNLTVKTRKPKLAKIPDDYIKKAILQFTPDEEEWKRRLDSRPGKTIPKFVLDNMAESMEYPTTDEGFESILMFLENNDE